MRLFVGIPLGAETAGELSALVARLRVSAAGLRWSASESWHITLQFLGNATPEQLQCLTTRLADVRSAPVLIELGELGSFERTGVFFADVAVTPGLAALQERVVAATSHCGFVAEPRPFHAHITLARRAGNRDQGSGIRKTATEGPRERESQHSTAAPRGLRDLMAKAGACRFSQFAAHKFLLYESHLSPQGSRYEVRARFPLTTS